MIRIVSVGRMKRGPERDLFDRYVERTRPRVELLEIAESRGSASEIRRKDASAILSACPGSAFVVALDEGGDTPDSQSFSASLETWLASGRQVTFVIGGAEGLESSVMARADARLSFGRMTWPHMLVRVLLAEQLYRARAISAGHPYHRAARP
ncbi:hypothetical protein AA21291_1207 [Swaminathania salitolerans LMG 21291]|uniref:Ribosomal RNA large subunit methyltransferase H n=1 Tax=Swaminathania salitolerans TaxID=182838 RepID=A0A511BR96_9PROT|nr:hypothetical protein AA21291_1207 [Swaminathania salitolerans LMG 21291]GEL02866.1 ribosomal RNA large subunit methyltransferase H [Swaminathania salitolerans]